MSKNQTPGPLTAPGFEPNFSSNHSVILNYPIARVFPILGTAEGHERVTRLSGLCSGFKMLEADTIAIPSSLSLADVSVRTASAPDENVDSRPLPRQSFTLTETVPVLFGLLKTVVSLASTLTWDEEAKLALYESQTESGILVKVWKLRKFEAIEEGNKTRVSETIQGRCPAWIVSMVRRQASAGHIAHMESYYTLFV